MKRITLLVVLLAVAAGACSRETRDQRQLDAARRRWEAAAITDYRYDIVIRCFCPPLDAGVTVSGSAVVSSEPLTEGATAPEPRTIDQLFDDLERELASAERGAYSITYHPDLGYPMSVSADPIELAVDDEYAYEILVIPAR